MTRNPPDAQNPMIDNLRRSLRLFGEHLGVLPTTMAPLLENIPTDNQAWLDLEKLFRQTKSFAALSTNTRNRFTFQAGQYDVEISNKARACFVFMLNFSPDENSLIPIFKVAIGLNSVSVILLERNLLAQEHSCFNPAELIRCLSSFACLSKREGFAGIDTCVKAVLTAAVQAYIPQGAKCTAYQNALIENIEKGENPFVQASLHPDLAKDLPKILSFTEQVLNYAEGTLTESYNALMKGETLPTAAILASLFQQVDIQARGGQCTLNLDKAGQSVVFMGVLISQADQPSDEAIILSCSRGENTFNRLAWGKNKEGYFSRISCSPEKKLRHALPELQATITVVRTLGMLQLEQAITFFSEHFLPAEDQQARNALCSTFLLLQNL